MPETPCNVEDEKEDDEDDPSVKKVSKVMLNTKCPHTQRKHYAKVCSILSPTLEHVFELLQEVRKEPERDEMLSSRSDALLYGHVPNLLPRRLP